jgi:thiol-disulfide isomerase/thioredoxin
LRVLAASLLAAALPAQGEPLVPWTGGETPELAARTLDGRDWKLADLRGRTVIVNFWATWCVPCVVEMPSLARLRDRLAAAGVEVMTVNFQENPARIEAFFKQHNLALPVVRDHDGNLRRAWQVNVFPSSFVVGPDQRVALKAVGEVDWDDPQVESRIRALR